jgi:hypothetical protein
MVIYILKMDLYALFEFDIKSIRRGSLFVNSIYDDKHLPLQIYCFQNFEFLNLQFEILIFVRDKLDSWFTLYQMLGKISPNIKIYIKMMSLFLKK